MKRNREVLANLRHGTALAVLALAAGMPAIALAERLDMALSAAVSSLDPHYATAVQTDLSVISHLYSPLVIRNPDMTITGVLAESWEALDDNTWRFTLHPDIAFPNGEALDAEAIKWNFDTLLDPDNNSRARLWYTPIEEIEVLSSSEFLIKTQTPFPGLIEQLTMLFFMPPEWSQENDVAVSALGTGPYDIAEYVPGERLLLRAKEDYFGGTPEFDEVAIRMITEPSVRVSALLAGEVDIIVDVPPTDIERINASGVATADWGQSSRMMVLRFNNLVEPFLDNRTLRQALNHGIDRQLIIDAIYEGNAVVSQCQMLSSMYSGFNPDLEPYEYDPDRARQLIAESGIQMPATLDLEIPLGRYLLPQEIGQVLAAQLEELGFSINIREIEFASWSTAYTAGNMSQMAYMGQAWPSLDADGLLGLYHPSNAGAYWQDEIFGELIEKARATVDEEERTGYYAEATARMCEEAPVLFLFSQPLIYAVSSDVEWQVRGDDWLRAYDIVAR